jgi:PKD repeat protein
MSSQKVGNITQIVLNDFIALSESPIAGFTADPLFGPTPFEIQFTDQSNGAGRSDMPGISIMTV